MNWAPPGALALLLCTASAETERSTLRQGKSLSGRLGTGNGAQHTQLLRIRTNDGSFGRKREFREFERQRTRLVAAPLPGTPRDRFFHPDTDANRWLTDWVKRQDRLRSKAMTIRDQVSEEVQLVFRVPERGATSRGTGPVVAMVSPVHGDASFHWNGKGVDPHLRHAFSSQSCCGCHCGDTNTEFSTSPHASAESGPSSRSSCAPMVPGSRLRIQPATSTSRPLRSRRGRRFSRCSSTRSSINTSSPKFQATPRPTLNWQARPGVLETSGGESTLHMGRAC